MTRRLRGRRVQRGAGVRAARPTCSAFRSSRSRSSRPTTTRRPTTSFYAAACLHPAEPPTGAAVRAAAKDKGYSLASYVSSPRLRLAQRRARRTLLRLRGQRRAAVREARRRRRPVERQSHRPSLDDPGPRLHLLARRRSPASAMLASTASSASTPRWPTTSRSGADNWIGPDVVITRDTDPNTMWRPARSGERRDRKTLDVFKVAG